MFLIFVFRASFFFLSLNFIHKIEKAFYFIFFFGDKQKNKGFLKLFLISTQFENI
jgi:hypothetical protein